MECGLTSVERRPGCMRPGIEADQISLVFVTGGVPATVYENALRSMTITPQMIQVYNGTGLAIGEKVNGSYTGALGALQNDLADVLATQLLYDTHVQQDFYFLTMSTYSYARWLKITL